MVSIVRRFFIVAFLLRISTPLAAAPPNIILIMADDLGYGELGCYGQEWIQTPNIDRIAADGIRFTQFYSGAPVCAPARCMLMTGKHSGHSYIRGNGNPKDRQGKGSPNDGYFPGQHPIPDSEVTIAEILKAKGYKTGATGKWGLGYEGSTGAPNRQGFDLFYGYLCQVHAHNHFPRFLWNNGEREMFPGNNRKLDGTTHSQDKFAENAIAFIRENKDQPFFLYCPFAIPHLSIQTTPEALAKYKGKIPESDYEHRGYLEHPHPRAGYAAMVTQVDDHVGKIMRTVKELGLDDNTIIMFTSDNGPTFQRLGGADSDFFNSSGQLRGRKGSVHDGGIRVPLVARWPGRIKEGTVTGHLSAFWDFLPTFAELADAETPAGLDGLSMVPTLTGQGTQQQHESLYWEFPSYGGQQAMRYGKWKAVRKRLFKTEGKMELYDMSVDIGENYDVADGHKELVQKLTAMMSASRTPSKLFPFAKLDKVSEKQPN